MRQETAQRGLDQALRALDRLREARNDIPPAARIDLLTEALRGLTYSLEFSLLRARQPTGAETFVAWLTAHGARVSRPGLDGGAYVPVDLGQVLQEFQREQEQQP